MTNSTITINRKARFNYSIEDTFEAGIELQGWEVKSIRSNGMQIAESYIIIKHCETWLLGSHINPVTSVCNHVKIDPVRQRKLLLHKKEINNLIGLTERKGCALVPLKLYWKRGRVKLEFALAKGKKKFDKRDAKKQQDWQRSKARIMSKKTQL